MDRLSQMHKLEFFNLEASIPPTLASLAEPSRPFQRVFGMRGRAGQNVLNGDELHAEQVETHTGSRDPLDPSHISYDIFIVLCACLQTSMQRAMGHRKNLGASYTPTNA